MNKKNLNIIKLIFFALSLFVLLFMLKPVFFNHFFNDKTTVVPNLINLTKEEAIKKIKDAKLDYTLVSSKTDKVPNNTIFIQFPNPGKTVKIRRHVNLWVNDGEGGEIPNVIGLELIEARKILKELNIPIERIDYKSSKEDYDTILSIYPHPGTKLGVNQKASLLVSSKELLNSNLMPNIVGLDVNEATNLLTQINLVINNITKSSDSTLPLNAIISTTPSAGTEITSDTKINVVINTRDNDDSEKTVDDIIKENDKEITEDNIESIIDSTLKKLDEKKANTDTNNNGEGNESDN